MKHILAILITLILALTLSTAQKITYHASDGSKTSKENASFNREISKQEHKLWEVKEVWKNGELKYTGFSTRKDGTEKHGTCISYFNNGKKKESAIYKENKKTGQGIKYYKTGEIKSKTIYRDNRLNYSEEFYLSGELKRKTTYKNKLISTIHDYYKNQQIKNELLYSGEKDGRIIKVKGFHPNGVISRDDEYYGMDQKLHHGTCYNDKGQTIEHTLFMRMPEFPGGENALRKYISQSLKYPLAAQTRGIQGKVFITFLVDKNGNVKKARVVRSVVADLDNEALRVVNSMPGWKPGIQFGELTNISYTVPINFKLR